MLKALFLIPIVLTTIYNIVTESDKIEDCQNAYKICELQDYHVTELSKSENQENLGLTHSNMKETYSYWYEFEVKQAGLLEFTIVPDMNEDDIDFVLYESEMACNNKKPLRIMTTGNTIGKKESISCIGNTGLRKLSKDTAEGDGCNYPDDNYLKPALLNEGYTYFLLVNNYNSSEGFTILFEGDKSLELSNTCNSTTSNDSSKLSVNIFPNPTTDYLKVRSDNVIRDMNLKVFDMSGKLFHTNVQKNFSGSMEIEVSEYTSGQYYVKIESGTNSFLRSFVKS